MSGAMSVNVTFTLNGELQVVDINEAAGKTLNEYIRFNTKYTGTKVSCAQGGCGACTVSLARPSQPLKSVDSCLTPLASAHGAAVLTVEGLSAESGAPHPVAERMAKMGALQCGYCTPGMVMQIFSTLSAADGGKACGEQDLEHCVNGNICRCTGYRPIIECAKSFASDTSVRSQIDTSVAVGPYNAAVADPKLSFPPEVPLVSKKWIRATSVAEVMAAMRTGAFPIAGGTGGGVFPDLAVGSACANGRVFVDINSVQDGELREMSVQEDGCLRVGALVTWTRFSQHLKGLPGQNPKALKELSDRCGSIAGAQVRNAGTIGGNVMLTRNKSFLSDWVPPLAALGAKVTGVTAGGQPMEEDLLAFVQQAEPFTGLILAVLLPLPSSEVVFKSFRVAKRSRNAHALANAGFAAPLVGGKLGQATLVMGAADPKPLRLTHVERALSGMKAEDLQGSLPSVLSNLSEKVTADLFPLACEFGRDQTAHIICGFLVKFLVAAFGSTLPKDWQSSEYCLHDMVRTTSAIQTFPPPADLKGPLNQPIMKKTSVESTTGAAKYVDDLPKPMGTLLGALVLCPEANVTVTAVDPSPAKQLLGERFHSLVTSAELSCEGLEGGELMGFGGLTPPYVDGFSAKTPLLGKLGEPTHYGGQAVALLLAEGDCPRLLEQAAVACSERLVFERSGSVLIGDMPNCPEVAEPISFTKGKKPAKDVIEAAKSDNKLSQLTGRFSKKSQSHFYIEPQSVLAIPDEGGICCYAACQGADMVQRCICEATGLEQSKVAVHFRRVGGGFGGKAAYPGYLAALASDVALKKKHAIRIVLPRETDMSVVGGRQEVEGRWEVAVDPKTGKLAALHYDIWMSHSVAGENVQKFPLHGVAAAIDECYDIASMSITGHLAKQHVVERTAVRAPGHLEASMLMEAVMDGVACSLGMPHHTLRERNFFQGSGNTSGMSGGFLPQGGLDDYSNLALWKLIKEKTGYEGRVKAVEEFNKSNVWKKRGISLNPARYGVFVPPGASCRVDIFKDSSVQVAVCGAEIGQGLHTKVGQMVSTAFARELGAGPPLSSIRFLDTSTEQTANGQGTGGSTSSETNMFAAGDACRQLAARLKKFAKAAKKGKAPGQAVTWADIVQAAFSNKFMDQLVILPNLSAVGMHFPAFNEMMYETYGVAAAEVELDVLTGESRVLFAHLMFDIGMSYNPMVDIGQMEGAFIMGLGHVLNEGVDHDHATGKLLTDNTWSYKPPIACDVPEEFNVDLVDLTKSRINNALGGCFKGAFSGLMGCMGIPMTPTKTDKALKSAKAIAEPPVLLCCAPHSALHAAIAAATGSALPENLLPIPAKAFTVLPMLQAQKPGSGSAPDDASTATGTSVSTQDPKP